MRWYERASAAGDRDGIYHLALCFRNGIGETAPDDARAVELYRKSGELGHPQALYNLGCCYMNGVGVAKDSQKAVDSCLNKMSLADNIVFR